MREAFPKVIGQAAAKAALSRAAEAGHLGGALLLAGPSGCGRMLLAHELAKALNCQQPEAPQLPCGECGPCQRIDRGNHPDVLTLSPGDNASGSIGIDPVRDLLDELALAPVEGSRRVFLIDPASALTEPAQHALLKGLEEPPERALLVLIAEREDELLDTVISRCRVLRLGALEPQQVEQVLLGKGLPVAEAQGRARWSGGSPGRALSEDALGLARAIDETLQQFSDGAGYRSPMELVDHLAKGFIDHESPDTRLRRLRLLELILRLSWALRDALVLQTSPEAPLLGGAAPADLAGLTHLPGRRLEAALDHLVALEEQVIQNVNPTLVLEGLVLDLGQLLAPRPIGAKP